jgi:DNA-binding GntR family transcriptional regulator
LFADAHLVANDTARPKNIHPLAEIAGLVTMNVALIAQTAGTANVLERARLLLNDPGAHVLRLARIRYDANDRPLAYEEVVLPLDRFLGLARHDNATSDIFELAESHGLLFGRARGRISVVRATGDIALHLGIVVGTHLLKLDRVIETTDGRPIEWRVAFSCEMEGRSHLQGAFATMHKRQRK